MSERYCILCVDDDVSGLEARAALLEEEGYSVTAVSCPLRANINWSFLDTARVHARIAAKRADDDEQLAQYQQSVLLARGDVENALVSYARSQDRDVQLQLAANDSKRAVDLASVRFRNGATGLRDLPDAQRVQLQAEDAYAESHSLPFYCTNRLLVDGHNGLLSLQKAGPLEVR
jgi:outer membrane protein TolC